MRGIRVDSQRLRELRRARGWSQRELAQLAGVGERTVRNAETGRCVRLEFLRYLAAALHVDVHDLIDDRDELRTALSEQRRVELVLTAINEMILDRDTTEYFSLAAKNILVNIYGPPEIPIVGEFRGHDGMRTISDNSLNCLEYERASVFHEVRASGKFVIISGRDWLRAVPTGKSFETNWMHVYEFDKDRLVRFDNWSDDYATIARAFQPG